MATRSFGDNVAEQSGSLGTGDYFLDGAVSGYRAFSDAFTTGDSPYYAVRNAAETKYEYNSATTVFTSGAPSKLTRGVWLSSNANAAIDWQITDLPLIIYIPTPGEILEGMVSSWTGTVRPPLLKFGMWSKKDSPSVGKYQITLFDGTSDIPVISVDTVTHAVSIMTAAGSGGLPQLIKSTNYTLALVNAGYHIYNPVGSTSPTWTIPANSSVAFPIGSTVTFINDSTNVAYISCTTDQLVLSPTGSVAVPKTLSQYGVATAVKVTATRWIISGTSIA